ncbi:hypothetical protein BX666DRAFT_1882471 [Dichotomocladium elegans]|nr:hypothetical protein BX666DRAFT_1882471 [Dichotomocladium elegans]
MNPTDYSFSSQEAGDQTPDQRNQPQNPYAFELHMPPQPLAQFGVGGSPAFSSRAAPGDMATGGRGMMGPTELSETIQLQTTILVQALASHEEADRQQAALLQRQAEAFAPQQEQLAQWARQQDEDRKIYTQQREPRSRLP